MKLLLDECIDRRLANEIPGHYVRTVPQMGWSGLKNGQLLSKAEKEFDVFVTVDKSLPFQQHLSKYSIALIVLEAKTNRIDDLKPLVPRLIAALPSIKAGVATIVKS